MVELCITGYSKKGHGVADGAEVAHSVKGDVILANLLKKRKNRRQTQVLEILKPSPDRCEPLCKHASVCGGCKWQQIQYSSQLLEKQGMIERLFPDQAVLPITPSADPWHYRGKMEFTFSQDMEGRKFLGLMQSNGRGKVINLEECHIAPTWMSEALIRVRQWWSGTDLEAFYPPKDKGALRTLTMRSSRVTGAKMVFMTLNGDAKYALSKNELEGFANAAAIDEKTSVFIVLQHTKKGVATNFSQMHLRGPESMEENLLSQTFHISPRAFFQPNTQMAAQMFQDVIDRLELKGNEKVLDLYCGMGTIGILLSKHVRQVIGVELSAEAISDAKEVIEESGLKNIQVFCSDVKTFLDETKGFFQPDIVIIDPPREGLWKETIDQVLQMSPEKIVYISCNPETQARDIPLFKGYTVASIRPYDQFPHTVHIENVVILYRDGAFK